MDKVKELKSSPSKKKPISALDGSEQSQTMASDGQRTMHHLSADLTETEGMFVYIICSSPSSVFVLFGIFHPSTKDWPDQPISHKELLFGYMGQQYNETKQSFSVPFLYSFVMVSIIVFSKSQMLIYYQ